MIIISDPSSGAVSLVFKDKEDLINCIDTLVKLKDYKETFGADEWPGVATIVTENNENKEQIGHHMENCRKYFK